MNTIISKIVYLLIGITIACACRPGVVQAKPLALFGTWKAIFQGDDFDATTDGLVQYREMYTLSYTPLVTRKITMNVNMGYSNLWLEESGTRVNMTPGMNLSVHNDLFSLGLLGNMQKNTISNRADYNTTDLSANLASSWTEKLWPTLSFRASRRAEETDETASFAGRSSLTTNFGSSVSWEYDNLKLYYDYGRSRSEEDAAGSDSSDQVRENHLAKVEYGDSYWNNRLSWFFSQLYTEQQTDFSFDGASALLKIGVGSGYAGIDYTPADGRLPSNSALVNGDVNSTAFTIKLQQPANLAVKTNSNVVDALYVYTTRDDRLLVASPDAMKWNVYTSNDGFVWQLAAQDVSSSFNRDEFRYEVSTGSVQAMYVKLVVTGWPPSLDVNVTEIEAYSNVTAGATGGNYDQTGKQYKTELSCSVLPVANTRLSYSFSRDYNEQDGNRASSSEKLAHTARATWDYSRYFTPSAGFNMAVDTNDSPGAVDTEDRSYDLQITSMPIATVDLSLNYSWSEHYEDNDLFRTANHLSLTATTAWYPDLSSALTLGYNNAIDELTSDESDSAYISLAVRSQLRKTLHVTLQSVYSFSNSGTNTFVDGHLDHGSTLTEVNSKGGNASVNINWRTSTVLSFDLLGMTTYGRDEENSENVIFSAQYLMLSTAKTNLNLSYSLNASSYDDTVQNIGIFWGWDISTYFRLNTSGNYILMDNEDSWNVYTQLTATF